MIFMHESVAQAQAGRKTNTRRPRQPAETYDSDEQGNIIRVRTAKGRIKWEVGRTYAMNPPPPKGVKARMGKQVGRILLKSIRCERVCDISEADVLAEGLRWDGRRERWVYGTRILEDEDSFPTGSAAAYLHLWESIYPKSDCTELVWVLEFEVMR